MRPLGCAQPNGRALDRAAVNEVGESRQRIKLGGTPATLSDDQFHTFVVSNGDFMLVRYPLLAGLMFLVGTASANEIYVDNQVGRDTDDGLTAEARSGNTGPLQSLGRAIQLARFGDTIVLRNTGVPYYGSVSLTGSRHSGTAVRPFVIEGNGATISGLRTVPQGGWQKDGPRLWKLTLTRKGYYRLLRNGKPLPESLVDDYRIDPRPSLKPGHWVAWRGSLYFKQDGNDIPEDQNFTYAAEQTGISLHHVSNVLITNVTLEHFRFDGVHAQGLCDGIVLENVTSIENGRAGIVSSGASKMKIFGGRVASNGRSQLLVLDRSTAMPFDCDIEVSPEDLETK